MDQAALEQVVADKVAEKQARNANIVRRQQLLLDNIDLLLNLKPDHDRTSCSDDNPQNQYNGRCQRCLLLDIRNSGYNDEWTINVQLVNEQLEAIDEQDIRHRIQQL